MTTKILSRRQARWAMILADYNFTITYRPSVLAIIPDVLSRSEDVYPSKGESFLEKNPNNLQQLLKQTDIFPSKLFSSKIEDHSSNSIRTRAEFSRNFPHPQALRLRGTVWKTTFSSSRERLWFLIPRNSN